MGTIDQARATATGFRQSCDESMVMLQAAGESIGQAQTAFLGTLGLTRHVQVVEVEARCAAARQKIAEAIQSLDAARQAADMFRASLS
jgi:hypothetical protein